MDREILELRHRSVVSYADALATALSEGWTNSYARWLGQNQVDSMTSPESMVLLHPWHYEGVRGTSDPRGNRRFGAEVGQRLRCDAPTFWGMECAFGYPPVADHVFPYSLGGPTVGGNRAVLCQIHNQMKSNDLHVFPWERPTPAWVPDTIERIALVLRYGDAQ
jgi:hypothetical protein